MKLRMTLRKVMMIKEEAVCLDSILNKKNLTRIAAEHRELNYYIVGVLIRAKKAHA